MMNRKNTSFCLAMSEAQSSVEASASARSGTSKRDCAGKASSAASGRRARTGERRELVVDGLPVFVARKRIKNVNMRVKAPDGRVEVSVPLSASDAIVASFVREKRAWIEAKRIEIVNSPRVEAAEASAEEVASWRAVVEACVPPLIAAWEPIMGVKAGRIAYRNMTSRWGSCQPATGRICINVRLALYPPECLEYVVVHELCHLRERGHGARFKDLMDTYLPDWRERRAKLR